MFNFLPVCPITHWLEILDFILLCKYNLLYKSYFLCENNSFHDTKAHSALSEFADSAEMGGGLL